MHRTRNFYGRRPFCGVECLLFGVVFGRDMTCRAETWKSWRKQYLGRMFPACYEDTLVYSGHGPENNNRRGGKTQQYVTGIDFIYSNVIRTAPLSTITYVGLSLSVNDTYTFWFQYISIFIASSVSSGAPTSIHITNVQGNRNPLPGIGDLSWCNLLLYLVQTSSAISTSRSLAQSQFRWLIFTISFLFSRFSFMISPLKFLPLLWTVSDCCFPCNNGWSSSFYFSHQFQFWSAISHWLWVKLNTFCALSFLHCENRIISIFGA